MRNHRCTVEIYGRVCREPALWVISDDITYGYACAEHFERSARSGLKFRRIGEGEIDDELLGPVTIRF